MLKERIQEIFEFTKSESPYRKANKGWINQDIFLDLSPAPDTFSQKNEAAKITVFWSPVNTLLSNIFIIIIMSSLIVFTSLSLSKGRLNFDLFNNSLINDTVKVEDNKLLQADHVKDLDSINNENVQNVEINDLDKINNKTSLDENQINSYQEKITTQNLKQDTSIKSIESDKEIKIIRNNKSKSNFI